MSVDRYSDIELGMLQMQILWLLSKRSDHGYELMKKLNELKKTKITAGTLYPTLSKLEKLGLIKSLEKKRIKVYTITAKGRGVMKNSCGEFCKTFAGIFHDFICGKCR
jgi:PadR family transcriptional regulator PadR